LTGANHVAANPNDIATQNAKAALTLAYNNAAGQTPTTVPTELAGQTLTAGAYTATSGTFGMTGTLVLDGQNNANAVFIFQTASTLITGGTGNVSLIRNAQACNVFWQVGSAATLGAGSTFRGTILAHDDISLGNGVTVFGRLFAGEQASGAGAVTLIHDTITRSVCAAVTTASATPTATASSTASVAPTSTATGAGSPTPVATGPVIPVGPVQTGDGSTTGRGHGGGRIVLAGGLALATVGVATLAAARRRSRRI
jgi:hypothetical protein